jgi:flagellar assembly protein FliH
MSSKVVKRTGPLPASPLVLPQAEALPAVQAADQKTGSEEANEAARVEAALREAYQRGRAEGEAAGRAAVEAVLERLAQSLEHLSTLSHRLRRQAEKDLVQLALAIARRVVRRELQVDPDAVAGLARAALDRLQGQEVQRVRVHPALEEALRRALERMNAPRSLAVVADAACRPGDVILETAHGNLDASVETQLQEIERGLADRLRHA